MSTNMPSPVRRLAVAMGTSLAALATTPGVAYAAGADILIPKPAEFIPALIAFLVIWVIMAKMAWPMIVGTLDKREEKIQGDLKAAEDAKAQAEETAASYKERINEADRKAADIIADAKREGETQRAEILAKAQQDAQAIIAKAHGAVEAEREKAMVELSGSVVDLSVEIASKIIGDALSVEEQQQLAEKYLAEVGSLNDD